MTGEGAKAPTRRPPDGDTPPVRRQGPMWPQGSEHRSKFLVNVHVNRPLTPALRRIGQQQSVRWGEGRRARTRAIREGAGRGCVCRIGAMVGATRTNELAILPDFPGQLRGGRRTSRTHLNGPDAHAGIYGSALGTAGAAPYRCKNGGGTARDVVSFLVRSRPRIRRPASSSLL
jgi:hypothetical protein